MSKAPLEFPGQQTFYRGKVRDVYSFGKHLLMITSNRISAFDVVLPREIPYKGQVLNQIAAHFLKATSDIVPNWLLNSPAPNAAFGLACIPIPIEMVVRGYLVGHLWREYKSGKRIVCGVELPDGLVENQKLPNPIITPTTKASEGHDEDISVQAILEQKIVSPEVMQELIDKTFALFARGQQMADEKNLILVDTKYEFGKIGDTIYLMDEIHTPDSSRYFYADGFEERQAKGEKQKQLSKEFVREWLIANDFMGKEGQTVPEMTDEWIDTISKRYIELFEKVTGKSFVPENLEDSITEKKIIDALERLKAI
jgi:phosphoribosylaminoimidazole-succinocarboxamide synthase